MSKTRQSAKGKALDDRVAIRKWLAKHGPWHHELPRNVEHHVLDAELRRLHLAGVLAVFEWEAEGLTFELKTTIEGQMAASRIYVAGPHWDSYVSGWD
jgi:hypothetical protein